MLLRVVATPGCPRAPPRRRRWCAIEATVTTRGAPELQQGRQQQPGQHEVAEVVGAELQLVAVLGLRCFGGAITPGVVDQQVERAGPPVGERAHRRHRGQVELHSTVQMRPGLLIGRLLARVEVAAGEHDLGAVLGERRGGVEADAGVGAGDHGAGCR